AGKSANSDGSITGDLSGVSDAMRSKTTVVDLPSLPDRKPKQGSQDDVGVIAGHVHFNPRFPSSRDDLDINPNGTVGPDFSHIKKMKDAMNGGLEGLTKLEGDQTVGSLGLLKAEVTQLAEKLGVKPEDVKGKTFKQIGEMVEAKIIKTQSVVRGKQGRDIAKLQAAIKDGVSGLATLKDDEGRGMVREDSQATQIAEKLGVKPEAVGGKTFKEIGEMAQAKINKDASIKALGGRTLKKAMDSGLEGLKDLSGPTTVGSLGLLKAEVKQLADMLGVETDAVGGKTFKQIGEMAQEKLAAIKLQSTFRGKLGRDIARLQVAINGGMSELATLNDEKAQVKEDSQVKQLADMLGVETDAVGGKTFKQIGEMAQVITAIERDAYLISQLRTGKNVSGGLDELKKLKGDTTVNSLGLGEKQVKQLAKMLGKTEADITNTTFKEIGEMAKTVNTKYYSLKSVNNSPGTNRIMTQFYKVKARFGIAYKEARVDGPGAGWNSLMSDKPNFDQALAHCGKLSTSNPSNFPKDEMRSLLIHNKYSLQEQCLTMDEAAFNKHYQTIYDQMSFFGSGRDALIKELFEDIKIQGGKSPDFKKLYRGVPVNATNT
ncbi:MAG: hypothetical protein VXX85_06440, partial [Candidatus Margulisiibacteriota bacterium]|nr:hypothetical protein [Candidatus Margulisiibacteriota bacterium]